MVALSSVSPATSATGVLRNTTIRFTATDVFIPGSGIPALIQVFISYEEALDSDAGGTLEVWRSQSPAIDGVTAGGLVNGWSGSRVSGGITLSNTSGFKNYSQINVHVRWNYLDGIVKQQNQTYHFWTVDDSAPSVSGVSPVNGTTTAQSYAGAATATFTDGGDGIGATWGGLHNNHSAQGSSVNKASVQAFYTRNGGAPVNICVNGVFQTGWLGSSISGGADGNPLSSPKSYDSSIPHYTAGAMARTVTLQPTGEWPGGLLDLTVTANDFAGNTGTSNWSFTVPFIQATGLASAEAFGAHVITAQAPVAISADDMIKPAFDTFRGGKTVLIQGPQMLVDTSLDKSFLSQDLSPWTSSTSGTGRARSGFSGLRLETGAGNGTATGIGPTNKRSFDVTLSVTLDSPRHAVAAAIAYPCTFKYTLGSDYAQISLKRDSDVSGISADEVVVTGTVNSNSTVETVGSTTLTNTSVFDLRIVHYLNYVFLEVNGIRLASFSRFSSSTGVGYLSAAIANTGTAQAIKTRVTNLAVRSAAIVNGRLLEDLDHLSAHRILGTIPAATLAEVGTVPIMVFGPWGSAVSADGFEYTLPDRQTIGRSKALRLSNFTDISLRD